MTIHSTFEAHILIVSPQGVIDFGSSNHTKEEIKSIVRDNTQVLLLDLSKVPFVDSTGAAVFISLMKFMSKRKGQLLICSANEEVSFAFRASKLDRLFTIYDNREKALHALRDEAVEDDKKD